MRRRILLLVGGVTVLVVLAFAIPLAVLIRHTVYNNAERALQSSVGTVAAVLPRADVEPDIGRLRLYLTRISDHRAVSVQLPSGRIIGAAPPGNAGRLPAPDNGGGFGIGSGAGPPSGPNSETIAWAGGRLAQLALPALGSATSNSYVIRAYASDDQLNSGESGWWWLLGGASVGLLVIGIVAAELITRRIVRPLVHTAQTAQRLAAGDVTARAPTAGPEEIAEVGRSLNRLADRIDELIAEERETVADLSHRLRTPLTALRLDAEALRDPVEAERVGTHVSTLERMLTAVIRAARRPQREGRLPSCDATAVVTERAAFWSALAEDQGRAGDLELSMTPIIVRAGAEDLAAAVDALLENVIAHTPEGTDYAVSLVPTPQGARLDVCDDGPGLPDAAAERGRSDRGSSGLGLDIARRCAEASGGAMTLGRSERGGARVTLDLHAP